MFIKPRRFIGIKRFEEILGVISRHGFDFMLEIAGLKKRRLFTKKHESRPVEVRIILEELGGCFVKLGQFLSLRPDLIPKEYSEELAKLQDSVASFSYSEAKAVVEHELGESLKHLFKEFSHEPVASASIGQVYKATLLSGKIVAVKVMRPGVKAQVLADLEILEYLARLLKQHVKPGVFDPEEIFAEFKRYTESELDYLKEAKSIKSAHESIRHQGISVPRVYSELTTKSVLVMEFLDGVPLSRIIRSPGDYKRIDKRLVCRRLANSFLSQVFIEGFFHADPHPGNILVSGKGLGLLDFGIVGWVDDALKDKLSNILISVVGKDADGLAIAVASLDLSDGVLDSRQLKQDLIEELSEYYDAPLDQLDIAGLFFKALGIARKHKMKVPRDFVLLVKCLVTLRGVCEELDPKFNIINESKPFIAQLLSDRKNPANIFKRLSAESRRFASFLKGIPEQTRNFYNVIHKADFALGEINRDLSRLTVEVRRESIRFIIAVIISALIISSSVTMSIDRNLSMAMLGLAGVLLAYLFFSIIKDHFLRR